MYLFLFLQIVLIHSYITRLPKCKYYGVFSSKVNKYNEGSVINTFTDYTQRRCTMTCIAIESCFFVNYSQDANKCEIIGSKDGNLVPKTGWQFISTDYTNSLNVGPICQTMKPCADGFLCRDKCEPPGFRCFAKNLALNGVASQSTTHLSYTANLGNDNRESTQSIAEYNPGPSWWKVDLKDVYPIDRIEFSSAGGAARYKLCEAQVADEDVEASYITVSLMGEGQPIIIPFNTRGQFVRIYCENPDNLHINELQVWVDTESV